MRKKIMIVGVAVLAVMILGGGFGIAHRQAEEGDTFEPEEQEEHREKLIVAFSGVYGGTSDMERVEKEINKIVREKLDVEVEFKVISGRYSNTINKMLAGKEQIDIVNMGYKMYMEAYVNGYLYDIEEVLLSHGKGIIEAVGMNEINACRINGTLYGLTNNRDYASGWDAYLLSKDILDKYQIAVEDIRTIEELEKIYDMLLEKEPDIVPVAPTHNMFINFPLADGFNGCPVGGHLNYGQDEEVVNIFESEEYKERLNRVRNWYLKGYMGEYSPLEANNVRERIRNGKVFSMPTKGKPGIIQEESAACGKEMVLVQFGENAISYNSMAATPWTVTGNTVSPEKSMQLLNLLYTDAEIMNLLSYGIEGEHYVMTEDGHITFPEGESSNLFIINAWRMPNQFITHVWEGNPLNLWELMAEHNKNAIQSCEIGFNFDITQVKSEYLAVNSIYNQYRRVLENGLVDPEEGLRAMLAELRENGLEDVIQEKRIQFEKWKVEQK